MKIRSLRAGLCVLAVIGLVRPAAAAAPAAPAHFVVRGTAPGTVTATWDAASGATEYRVYADVDPILTLITVIPVKPGLGANAQLVTTVNGTTAAFVVNSTDHVSNASTATANYVVSYGVCVQYDTTKAKHAGSVIPIKIAPDRDARDMPLLQNWKV